jgi:hypothetical protein
VGHRQRDAEPPLRSREADGRQARGAKRVRPTGRPTLRWATPCEFPSCKGPIGLVPVDAGADQRFDASPWLGGLVGASGWGRMMLGRADLRLNLASTLATAGDANKSPATMLMVAVVGLVVKKNRMSERNGSFSITLGEHLLFRRKSLFVNEPSAG